MILKTVLYNNHENHLTNRQGGFLIPKIESGYAGADGKPAAPLPYHTTPPVVHPAQSTQSTGC